jgi:hypothetical protein
MSQLAKLSAATVLPIARAIDWIPLLVASAVTLVLTVLTAPGDAIQVQNLVATARMCAVLLGAAAGFAMVDVAAEVGAAAPSPRWLRQSLRAALALLASAAVWSAGLALMTTRAVPGVDLGVGGLVAEAAVWLVAGVACTAFAVRWQAVRVAAVAGAAALLGLAVSTLFDRERFWPLPADVQWDPAHQMWIIVLPVVIILLGVANRDVRR